MRRKSVFYFWLIISLTAHVVPFNIQVLNRQRNIWIGVSERFDLLLKAIVLLLSNIRGKVFDVGGGSVIVLMSQIWSAIIMQSYS